MRPRWPCGPVLLNQMGRVQVTLPSRATHRPTRHWRQPDAHRQRRPIARIRSFAFSGIEAVPVEVQVQISSGLPAFLVVGLPDKAVGEARERVRAALTAMGLSLPPRRVLINLAPADLLKEGSHFDLPIALAVLAAMDVLPREELAEYAALGELSLDGSAQRRSPACCRRRSAPRPPIWG